MTGDATSTCVTGVQPGSVSAGFWYRSADAAVTGTGLFMRFYTGSNCTGFVSGTGALGLLSPEGVWREHDRSGLTSRALSPILGPQVASREGGGPCSAERS